MLRCKTKLMKRFHAACLLMLTVPSLIQAEPLPKLTLMESRKIWDHAPHNAFTDLIHFKGKWFCVFREGEKHVSEDGALRVITSKDGKKWESAALITSEDSDLRDAKITVTPDGMLMLSGAEAMNKTVEYTHQSLVRFSEDGKRWCNAYEVGVCDNWLWRITWNKEKAYGFGYGTKPQNRGIRLFQSEDGKQFETLIDKAKINGTYPNETSMVFMEDDTCYCLVRQDGKPNTGVIGTAKPPYIEWKWKRLNRRIGGPHMILLPSGQLLATVRLHNKPVRTSLCWLDPEQGKLTEVLQLPSGGDTSYAGMVWHNDHLWISYYSSHEGKASIYLATVKVEAE